MKTYLNRQYISHFLLWGISAVFMASAVIPQAKAASMKHADMEGMDDMDMGDMNMPAQKPKPHQQSTTPAQQSGHTITPNTSTKAGTSAYPPITPSAQWPVTPPPVPKMHYIQHIHPVMDHNTYFHALLEQFEGRYTPGNSLFRYSGQAWFGTDYNKFWMKSEGVLDGHHRFSDGDHEFFYDRAISTYFDVQAGIRLDVDSGPTRAWGAVGVQGLALYFFDVSATAYFNNTGVAGKLEGSYDFLITNRLILQPQAELNFYSHADPERSISRGFSDIDAGLRLRYEFKRQIAPYIAVTYAGHYGSTASVARNNTRMAENGPEDLRFTFGIRSWF